jgi:hypothetical protein
MILAMSLHEAMPLLESHWDGSACVDATVTSTYAKGLASDSPVTSTDPDAAWYVRTAKHKDPLALDDLTPAQQDKNGAKLQEKTDRIKKRLYGYDAPSSSPATPTASLCPTARPTPTSSPLWSSPSTSTSPAAAPARWPSKPSSR